MTTQTTVKIALALSGLAVFGVGLRLNQAALRWTGIAIVAVAWVLRFWKAPRGRD